MDTNTLFEIRLDMAERGRSEGELAEPLDDVVARGHGNSGSENECGRPTGDEAPPPPTRKRSSDWFRLTILRGENVPNLPCRCLGSVPLPRGVLAADIDFKLNADFDVTSAGGEFFFLALLRPNTVLNIDRVSPLSLLDFSPAPAAAFCE